MRTTCYLAAALGAVLCGTAVVAAQTGNGAPSGSHYNLNIIGVPNYKNQNMDGSGNVIFVALGSSNTKATTKILLSPGEFGVLDKNGTDGTASFSLPAGGYTVWVRPLGKPFGSSKTALCGTVTITTIDPATGLPVTTTDVLCSLGYVATRTKGKQSFTNVTPELTTITLTVAITCGTTVIPAGATGRLFDPRGHDFFFQYENFRPELLPGRFFPRPS